MKDETKQSLDDLANTGIAGTLAPHETVLLESASLGARISFERDGECRPVLLGARPDMTQLEPLPLSGAPRGLAGRLVQGAKEHCAVVLITEAWITHQTMKPDSAVGKAIEEGRERVIIPPRVDPNRQEAVMLQLFSGKRHILRRAIITRPANGIGKPTLGPWLTTDNLKQKLIPTCLEPGRGGYLASGDVKE